MTYVKFYFIIFAFIISISTNVYSDLVWSDEFDGSSIDKSIWTYDVGGDGYGNGQQEYNTARHENSYIEDGNLVLEARDESYMGNSFTSARMLTQGRFAFKYGTLEARIKFPDVGNGLWPAFWLLGNNFPSVTWPECGEIDIVEIGSAAGIEQGLQNKKINAAIHYDTVDDGTFDENTYEFDASWIDASVDLNLDYHLYKLEWTTTSVTVSLDNVPFWTFDITADNLREFHQPCFPILNIAVGSWPTGYTGLYYPEEITAPFPAKMYVDYIRLYSNENTEMFFGEDIAETGNFGVFTETIPVENALVFGGDTDPEFYYSSEAALYTWNNMTEASTPATPSEGSQCWTFDVGAGTWYGLGVYLPNFRNMQNYSDGYLHFDIQTTLTDEMKIGIKSSRGGEYWLPLGDEADEFGFARDGQWHSISIPLNRFSDTDFMTIHQMFMLSSDAASATTSIAFDNIYWEPSLTKPAPSNGNFGIYTETTANKDAGEFTLGVDGNFFVWEKTLETITQTPYEGNQSISLQSAAGLQWFGLAFTPNVKYNLSAFSYPNSKLHFAMKTSSNVTFQIGMKSGNIDGVGQKWIKFEAGSDPYGFQRDGSWHEVEIPMSDMTPEVDLFNVSQFFEILGTDGPVTDIEIDDIYFTGGGDSIIEGQTNSPPSVSITSPTDGTFFNPGDDITITVDAADSDGTITKVEFLNGLEVLGQDTSAPYSFTINDITEGAYTLRARATDSNDISRTSSSVMVYVGTSELNSISLSPTKTTIEEGKITNFTLTGYDQFGLVFPLPQNVTWSSSGGGVIDDNGYFAAVGPEDTYTVTAEAVSTNRTFTDTATVDIFSGGLCTGQPSNGDFTWQASGIEDSPSLTFIPSSSDIGDTLLLLYYSNDENVTFPGYSAEPSVPFYLTGAEPGDIIYFYYTYSTPAGQQSTFSEIQSFEVGNCPAIVASDFDGDGIVNLPDFAILASYWLSNDCDSNNEFCQNADHVKDGDVDIYDLELLIYNWLNEGTSGSNNGTTNSPSVSITNPIDGEVIAPNATVTIEADATDPDGSITKVEFYEGANYLGQATSSPFTYTWANVSEGQYILTAIATDDTGLSTTSDPITVYAEIVTHDNAVNNDSFEAGDGTDADNWEQNAYEAGTLVQRSSESPYTGDYAIKYVIDWTTGGGPKAELSQTTSEGSISGSDTLDFSFWYKGTLGVSEVAQANIQWLNADGNVIGSSAWWTFSPTETYQQFNQTGLSCPELTSKAKVTIQLVGGALENTGTMYLDDVSLSQ